jgi:glycosyltransferase involved in cell wall biosynthesis
METSPTTKRKPDTDPEIPVPEALLTKPRGATPPPPSYTTNGEPSTTALARAFRGTEAKTPEPVKPAEPVEKAPAAAPKRPLALFCYEGPETAVGGHVARLASAFARRGLAVHLFTRVPFPNEAGVKVHATGGNNSDLLAGVEEYTCRACAAYLQQFPAGAAPVPLVGHEWSSVPAVAALRQHTGGDLLLSLHSLERQRSDLTSDVSRRIEELELAGLPEARSVLVHNAEANEILKYRAPDSLPRVVRGREPFPVAKFNAPIDRDAVKRRYQVGPVDPLILYVGDLDERHGADVLMKSVPAVLKNHPAAHFVFVGDGTLLWPLRVWARYLLLEHRVRFAGSVEGQAIYDLIQASDLVVVPSREPTEWWPFQAAWAARRPVVATHGLAGSVLEHERDGVLIYPHESSCVWGIERVLFDAGLRDTLARRGAEKLEARFGWNSLAEQVEELLGIKQAV